MTSTLDHWIDGAHRAPSSGRYVERRSPVDGSLACHVGDGTPEDVAAAAAAVASCSPGVAPRRPSAAVC